VYRWTVYLLSNFGGNRLHSTCEFHVNVQSISEEPKLICHRKVKPRPPSPLGIRDKILRQRNGHFLPYIFLLLSFSGRKAHVEADGSDFRRNKTYWRSVWLILARYTYSCFSGFIWFSIYHVLTNRIIRLQR